MIAKASGTNPDRSILTVVEPAHRPAGGIVVIQELFGVNGHVHDICRRLANLGYIAVAPHLYHRTGDPILDDNDIEGGLPHMAALSAAEIRADVGEAVDHLSDAGLSPQSIGLIGFCMGGTVATALAAEYELGASVAFYGGGTHEGRFGFDPLLTVMARLSTPWLGIFGASDTSIPLGQVAELEVEARRASVPTEIRTFDAGHAFMNDRRDSFDAGASEAAWDAMVDWLDTHVEK